MKPLGLAKTRFKVPGHGRCPTCLHLTRKQLRHGRPLDYNVARTGRAREKNRRPQDDAQLSTDDL